MTPPPTAAMPASALHNGGTSMHGGIHRGASQKAAERQYTPHDVPQEAHAHLASLSQEVPREADTHVRLPTIADTWHAQDVIRPHAYHTPLLRFRTLGTMTRANPCLIAENVQHSRAHKIRCATHIFSRLSTEERARGGVGVSADNRSQGGSDSGEGTWHSMHIVMPVAVPLAKVTATQGYGANVVLYRDSYNENLSEAKGYAVREARPVFDLGFR